MCYVDRLSTLFKLLKARIGQIWEKIFLSIVLYLLKNPSNLLTLYRQNLWRPLQFDWLGQCIPSCRLVKSSPLPLIWRLYCAFCHMDDNQISVKAWVRPFTLQVLITTALKSGGASPQDVTFLALHGTGTPLGDPIEIGAIAQSLGAHGVQHGLPLTLSSVKVLQIADFTEMLLQFVQKKLFGYSGISP